MKRMNKIFMRAAMTLVMVLTTMAAWAGNVARRLEVCEGGLNTIHVKGYAYYTDASQQSKSLWVYVDIYSDEACTNQYGDSHSIKANVLRPDINDRGIDGDHGFDADIPIDDAGIYYVKVYVQQSVLDTELINSPYTQVTVTEPVLVTLSGSQSYTALDGDILTGSTDGTVTIADGARVTLLDVTINGGIVCEGSATITLEGTNSVTGPQYKAGIQVGRAGTTLTIRGDGALTVTGGENAAGIGLSRAWEVDTTGGDIIIESGTITATGNDMGAGIGTGAAYEATATLGNITIKGGKVTANGGGHENALGIGTGFIYTNSNGHASIGAVTIYDTIDWVDISNIWSTITYMHGETDVTANASDYFNIVADGNRRMISSKSTSKDYAITIADGIENGSLAGPATGKFLERVTMTAIPDEGYGFRQLIVKDSQDNDIAVDGTSFIMPQDNVTVSAVFWKTNFAITTADGIEHGTITGPANANYGDRVTMTATPDEGYSLFRLLVRDSQGNDIAVDGTSFIMPQSDVTVSAIFILTNHYIKLSGSQSYTAQDGDWLTGSTTGTVTIADGARVTLRDVTINGGIVCDGSATITLEGTNSVTGSQNKAGIQVGSAGTTLTIRGDGSLTATGGDSAAGIGLSYAREVDATGGDIVVEDGTITSNGGAGGAGIGTGAAYKATATLGNITIKGGTVTANGGEHENALGIGTGFIYTNSNGHASIGAVTIYDTIDWVDISKIWATITYMHGETDVTANASNYFNFAADGNRRMISSKSCGQDYPITIADDIEHGSLTGPATAKFLERVTMTPTPDEGYGFRQLMVKDSQGNDVAAEGASFIMLRDNVTVSAEFSNSNFFITIANGIELGTITGPANANYGERVTMTATPGPANCFRQMMVKDVLGNDIAVEGTSFIMPRSSVTVSAEFYHNYDVNLNDVVNYTAWDGDKLTGLTDGTLTIPASASVTLRNATIGYGIKCNGTATITLVGTNSVTVPASTYRAGILVGGEGTTLTIKGDGDLTVKGGRGSAGIGLSEYSEHVAVYGKDVTGGDIVIEGGNIIAIGGPMDNQASDIFGAGIGWGMIDVAEKKAITLKRGDITIKGGTVTAIGSQFAHGIGKGYTTAPYSTITIIEGNVTVYDDIIMVDASSISEAVTYMHGDTDVTSRASDYFTITNDGNRRIIESKVPVTIADGIPFTQGRDHTVPSATYTKTLDANRVNKYQAWMVPFDYTITDDDLEKFTFYKIHMIANAPSPSVEPTDEVWVFLTKLSTGAVLHGNMPYVYVPLTSVENYTFTTAPATVKGRNRGVIAKTETLEDIYSFYATNEDTSPSADDPFYYVNIDGELSLGNSDQVTVGPYRWIIRKTSKYGTPPAYAPRMHFYDGEETDSLTPVPSPKGEGSGYWYDLSGRRVSDSSSVTRHSSFLKKGIYINNGKKIIMK